MQHVAVLERTRKKVLWNHIRYKIRCVTNMNMSQIACTKWHNTNKMAEFTNDFNKVFGNIDYWFRINVLSLNLERNIFTILD